MKPVKAHEILQAAGGHMTDRAKTYDKPEGERSMGATVAAFRAVTGINLTEEQGWLLMVLLKAVRSQQGGYRADNYEDGAAYFALAGETASIQRALPTSSDSDGWLLYGDVAALISPVSLYDLELSDESVQLSVPGSVAKNLPVRRIRLA